MILIAEANNYKMKKDITYFDLSHLAAKVMLPVILLFLGLFSAYSQSSVVSQGIVTQSFELQNFQSVSVPIYNALSATLQEEIEVGHLEPGTFGLLSWKQNAGWGIGTVGIRNELTNIYSPEGSFLIIAREESGGWLSLPQYDSQFESWLNQSPETFISRDAIPLLAQKPSQTVRQTQGIPLLLRFPWQDNQEWYLGVLGIHGGSSNALDFIPNPAIPVDERMVVAAYRGVVISQCNHPDERQNWVVIRHPDSEGLYATEYLHLDRSASVPGVGTMISEGQIIGRLLNETPLPNEHCGSGDVPHVHFGVGTINSSGGFVRTSIAGTVINGWTVNSDSCLTKENLTVCSNYSLANKYFSSSTGTVGGQVNDISNQPTQGAEVKFFGNELIRRESSTNVSGWYVSPDVPAGLATIIAVKDDASGFVSMNVIANQSQQAPNITLNSCPVPLGAPLNTFSVINHSPTTDCSPSEFDSALLIAHITLPDGTAVSPGEALVKTWRMRNTGSTTWGSGYQLVFLSGEQMDAPATANVPATSPNQEVDISINLVAPLTGGDHIGYWRLRNPQGTYFGPLIWVSLHVPDGAPSPPNSNISLTCLNCPANVTPGQTFRPTFHATVHNGQLLESRGDMLRNKDGNLFGAWPHVAVVGTVNAGQEYDFTFYADNPLTAPTTEGTYETKWQVWRDGNWDGEEFSIHFDVRASGSNHRPNRPDPLSPGDWHVEWDGSQVQLCAQHNGDPDGDPIVSYEFDVTGANTWNSGEVSTSCVTTVGLGYYTYGWRVRVKDNHNEWSDWSDPPWRFTIHDAAAIQGPDFSPPSPSAADTVKVWACSNGGTMKYWVNLANDCSGNGIWWQFNEGPICPDPSHSDPNLWPGWQTHNYTDGGHLVRVENGLGGAVEACYTLLAHRPARPELLNPPDQSYQNSRTVTFVWDHGMFGGHPTRATSYTLKASTDPDPNQSPLLNVTVDANTTSYTYTFNQDYAALYWRVTSNNAQGSNDSDFVFRFGIDRQAPSSAVQPLPDNATDTIIVVNWPGTDNQAGIRWYDVQYRDDARGEWVDWQTDVTLSGAIFIGQPGHRYCFRARAYDRAGNEEDWPGGDNGDTCTTLDPTAVPPSAWWDDNYASKRNLLILNNDSDTMAAGYPVRIHFDGGTSPSAEELYTASQSAVPGDDFRIIYNNATELPRWIQNFSSSQIDIWFKTQAAIPGNSSNNTDYQLYYGNPAAANPPDDIDDVMPPGEDANTMGVWHFAEGTGATFADSSERGHNGSLVNTYSWGEDSFGPYIEWFGGGDGQAWGEIPSSADFDLNHLTMEAWIYPIGDGATPEMTLLYRPLASPDDCPGYKLAMTDMKVDLQLNCAGGRNNDGQLSYNTWYHIAATYDGSNMRVYRNGILMRTVPYNQSINPTTNRSLYLGGTPWSQTFRGRVRHVRLSNIARTDFSYATNITAIDIAPSLGAGEVILPPGSGSPDLALLTLATYPNPDGGVLIQAVAQNQGSVSTTNGFFTDVYLDHLPTGPDISGSIQFWVNDPVAPGAIVTLTAVITDFVGFRGVNIHQPNAIEELSGTLYAQTDSSGVVHETNNTNNIYSNGVETCIASADSYDGNGDDSWDEATPLPLNTWQRHNIHRQEDEDWFAIQATAGQAINVRTTNLDNNADTYLYLYASNGTTLLQSNDDYNGSLASQINWIPSASGTYYIKVKHWNPNASGCGTSYTIVNGWFEVFLPAMAHNYTPTCPTGAVGETRRVSVASGGIQANGASGSTHHVSTSADGCYIAFYSDATNLVPGDTNGVRDVFVRNQRTGTTIRTSVASNGSQGNGQSGYIGTSTPFAPGISDDGRYVVFESLASNLISNDTNNVADIFVRDLHTSTTTRVSIASDGGQANGTSYEPFISASGRYVIFVSVASNLVPGDTSNSPDVFVHDRTTGQTTRVSIASNGTPGNASSGHPSISADGRFVAFDSYASNLVSGDTNGFQDVFVRDRQTGQTTRVSLNTNGSQVNGNSWEPMISADGLWIVFSSTASNLVAGDTNAVQDVFLHNRVTGQTTRISVASNGSQGNDLSNVPSISADGRYMAFQSPSTNLVTGDTNITWDVYIHDRVTGETIRASVNSSGTQGNFFSWNSSIASTGRFVTFSSFASNLVLGDTNGTWDIFVHNLDLP